MGSGIIAEQKLERSAEIAKGGNKYFSMGATAAGVLKILDVQGILRK